MRDAGIGFVDVSCAAAFDYVRRSLQNGLSLARAVVAQWPNDQGIVLALAPSQMSGRLVDFESGGILEQPARWGGMMSAVPNTNSEVARFIGRYLGSIEQSVVVIEDTEGYYETPAGQIPHLVVQRFGAESYGQLSVQANVSEIAEALKVAYSMPAFNVFLTRWDESPDVPPSNAYPPATAHNVRGVLVGAYDAESYLLWLPEPDVVIATLASK